MIHFMEQHYGWFVSGADELIVVFKLSSMIALAEWELFDELSDACALIGK